MGRQTHAISQKSITALGWDDLLSHLAGCCHTERGKALALDLPFLPDRDAVEMELARVSQARDLHDKGEPLPFGSVQELAPQLDRLQKEGILDAPSLLRLAETLEAGARLATFLSARDDDAPLLSRIAAGIAPLTDLADAVRETFEPNGEIADDASPDLGRLRRQLRELHERANRSMRTILERPEVSKFLYDSFYTQREDRYVLPVRSDSGRAVEGIVHGSSASGATIFVEPAETVQLNNRLKVAEMEVAREERRILVALSEMVRSEVPSIRHNLDLLQQLDVINARARLARRLAAAEPEVNEQGDLYLQAMRHPLMVLAARSTDDEVVPNDLRLDADKAMVITGPNAGGKTVCLKTLGLCVLMVRGGMQVPAGPDSRMPLYNAVLTEMGDDQSIEQSLSTFTAHLTNLLDFLEAAQPGALLLLDEIGVGTDPREGAALAQALLEGLVATGGQVVVTTHFERLKSLPLTDDRFANASVGFDLDRMRPTYRLTSGVPGSSSALDVARRLGLSPVLAERASRLLEGGGEDLARLLNGLAGERARLEEQRQELARSLDEAKLQEARWTRKVKQIKDKQKRDFDRTHERALAELRAARAELTRVRGELRRKPSAEALKRADRQIDRAAGAVRRHEPKRELEGKAVTAEELLPGSRVLVPRLGGEGTVLEPPKRGKVTVQVGALRSTVEVSSVLRPSAKTAKPKPKTPKLHAAKAHHRSGPEGGSTITPALIRSSGNTLDVRGMRVHEALAEADRFVDQGLRAEEPAVFIIHGHGTGALRAALRRELSANGSVQRLHAAEPEDGGEGVTVVHIN